MIQLKEVESFPTLRKTSWIFVNNVSNISNNYLVKKEDNEEISTKSNIEIDFPEGIMEESAQSEILSRLIS